MAHSTLMLVEQKAAPLLEEGIVSHGCLYPKAIPGTSPSPAPILAFPSNSLSWKIVLLLLLFQLETFVGKCNMGKVICWSGVWIPAWEIKGQHSQDRFRHEEAFR